MRYSRYQPVWFFSESAERMLALIEVFMIDGHLSCWSSAPIAPWGDDVAGLVAELAKMTAAVLRYRPVPFSELRVGMTFEKISEQPDDHSADPPKP